MERWKSDLIKDIGRILRENQEAGLGAVGAAIWLQQELGLSWEEAIHFARCVVRREVVPVIDTKSLREHGVVDVALLEQVYRIQAEKMAKLFARTLNQSEEEYNVTLPSFLPMPYVAKYPEEPLVPLIVEGRIPWREQARLSGIRIDESLTDYDISEWNSQGFVIPERPFTTWVSIYYGWRVTRNFKEGHRGAGIIEGIAYRNAYPHMIKDSSSFKNALVVLLGSAVSGKGSNKMDHTKAVCLDGRSDSSIVTLRLFPNNSKEGSGFNYLGSGTDIKT